MGLLPSIHTDRSHTHASQTATAQAPLRSPQTASAARKRAAAPSDTFEGADAPMIDAQQSGATKMPQARLPQTQGFFARWGQKLTGFLHLGTGSLHTGLQWGARLIDELRAFAVNLMSTLGAATKDLGTSMLEMARNLRGPEDKL